MQQELDIGTDDIDLSRFVTFEPARFPVVYQIGGTRKQGRMVGTIRLKHSSGYEILLKDEDGKITSHNPYTIFPVLNI